MIVKRGMRRQLNNKGMSLVEIIIAMTILYNIVSFINTQFLYRTPLIISSVSSVVLAIYCCIKEIMTDIHELIPTFCFKI